MVFLPHYVGITLSIILGIGTAVVWFWAIIECWCKEPTEGKDIILWSMIIVFMSFFGAVLYLVFRRPERIRKYGR